MTKNNSPRKSGFDQKKSTDKNGAGVSGTAATATATKSAVRQRTRPTPLPPDQKAPRANEASGTNYSVGYRKPPKHSQFKPGQSGNPKGRNKDATGMKTLASQMLTEKVSVRTSNGVKKMTRMNALLHKLNELGMKGNPRALLALINIYDQAVPEIVGSDSEQLGPPLTQTDEATLALLKNILLQEWKSS